VRGHHAQVQRHADAEEEQAEQDAAERLDVRFNLVPEGRLAQQHTGEERAHRHRQAGQLHQQRRAQHHQQRGGGHHLARLRFGQHAEQRIEQEAANQHQADDGTNTNRHRQPARAFAISTARARAHPGHQRQQRHNQQVFEQQDGDDLLPRRQRDVTTLGQQLHHHRGGGQHEAGGTDEGHLPWQAEQLGDTGQHHRTGDDLQRTQPEDLLAQAPQVRGPHLQADHEQEHHHAELGGMQDGLRVGEPAQPERSDRQAGSEVAQHRAQAGPAEQRHHHHRRAQQGHDLDQLAGRCFYRHAVFSPRSRIGFNNRAMPMTAIARMLRRIVLEVER